MTCQSWTISPETGTVENQMDTIRLLPTRVGDVDISTDANHLRVAYDGPDTDGSVLRSSYGERMHHMCCRLSTTEGDNSTGRTLSKTVPVTEI